MTRALAVPALLLAAAIGSPALGQQVGDRLGVTIGEVATALEAQGLEVREAEIDGDEIEVEIRRDGIDHDIDVSRETGRILRIERD